MYVRILIFLLALAILVLLLRSIFRDVSESLRGSIYRKKLGNRGVEEPASVVETVGDKMILRIALPGITSEGDIKVKKLSRSIEVRAYAGDKVYFKLFPIPLGAKIISKRMEEGEYIIELHRG